jgi:hypothetical protein
MGVGGQRHAPAALPPGKTRYPLYRRLGVQQARSQTGAENLAPTGMRSADHFIPAHSLQIERSITYAVNTASKVLIDVHGPEILFSPFISL